MIKYIRLTKEQLEELHQEFINFLASQTITSKEWAKLKEERPEAAEQELDVFSDLIWEGVLKKTEYLENISRDHINLFWTGDDSMSLIVIKILDPSVDVTKDSGLIWLQENILSDYVEIFTASKDYSADRSLDKFNLIKQGAIISEGELYRSIDKIIKG
jgi:hypothetical protein